MPLEFNVAELAGRLRRSLGVRGRIPLSLDEVAVPIVLAGDATISPFRLSGRAFRVGLQDAAGVATLPWVTFWNQGPKPCVITELMISNIAGAAQLIRGGFASGAAPAFDQTATAITGELALVPDSVIAASQLTEKSPTLTAYSHSAQAPAAVVQTDFWLQMALSTKEFVNCEITLYPGAGYIVQGSVVNGTISVSARATIFES